MKPEQGWICEAEPANETQGPLIRSSLKPKGMTDATYKGCSSLYEIFERSCSKYPNNPLLGERLKNEDGSGSDYKWMTYREVKEKEAKVKGDKSLKAALVQQTRTAPDMSEEVKREANENIQIHDTFQAQEQESKEKEAKVKGDKSLKAALVQQKRTAPDMSEEVKREANENIQIHDAFQAQEQESKE